MAAEHSPLAVRAVVAIYREFEQIARRSDISMAQYRFLLYLSDGPKRAGAIAAAAEIAKPTVSLAINSLQGRGWVESVGDADGRASVVRITAAGKSRMMSFEGELASAMESMLGGDDQAAMGAALAEAYIAMSATKEERMATIERGISR